MWTQRTQVHASRDKYFFYTDIYIYIVNYLDIYERNMCIYIYFKYLKCVCRARGSVFRITIPAAKQGCQHFHKWNQSKTHHWRMCKKRDFWPFFIANVIKSRRNNNCPGTTGLSTSDTSHLVSLALSVERSKIKIHGYAGCGWRRCYEWDDICPLCPNLPVGSVVSSWTISSRAHFNSAQYVHFITGDVDLEATSPLLAGVGSDDLIPESINNHSVTVGSSISYSLPGTESIFGLTSNSVSCYLAQNLKSLHYLTPD